MPELFFQINLMNNNVPLYVTQNTNGLRDADERFILLSYLNSVVPIGIDIVITNIYIYGGRHDVTVRTGCAVCFQKRTRRTSTHPRIYSTQR